METGSIDDEAEYTDQSNMKVQIQLNRNQTMFGSDMTYEDAKEAREIAKEALKKKSIFLQKNKSVRLLKPGLLEQRMAATRAENMHKYGLMRKSSEVDHAYELRATTGKPRMRHHVNMSL